MIPTTSSLLLDTDRIYYLGQCSDLLASMSEVDSSLATHRMEGWLRNLALDHTAPTPATRVQRRTARFKSRAQNLAFTVHAPPCDEAERQDG